MVDTTFTAAKAAIRDLIADGFEEREIHRLVTDIAIQERPPRRKTDVEDLPIHDELPAGLIDLPSAAAKYGRNVTVIRNWIYRGRVPAVARLRAPARGGGYLAVREDDLIAYMNAPPNLGGRPHGT